jgi:hypothetical protein
MLHWRTENQQNPAREDTHVCGYHTAASEPGSGGHISKAFPARQCFERVVCLRFDGAELLHLRPGTPTLVESRQRMILIRHCFAAPSGSPLEFRPKHTRRGDTGDPVRCTFAEHSHAGLQIEYGRALSPPFGGSESLFITIIGIGEIGRIFSNLTEQMCWLP